MELRNAPLLATKRDQALFVDREEIVRHLFDSAKARLNTVLVGPRGAGKTSVLNRFLSLVEQDAGVRRARWLPVAIAGAPTSASDFLSTVLIGLANAMEAEDVPFGREVLQRTLLPDTFDDEATVSLVALLRALRDLSARLRDEGIAPVFLVDEVADPTVAHTVFGRMRDELWAAGGTWIVASDGAQRDALLEAPADVFFERTLEVGPLSREASRELLLARLKSGEHDLGNTVDEETLERVVELSSGLPLSLISLLRTVLEGTPLEETEALARAFELQVSSLSEPAQRLVSALRDRGGLGRATDEDLQWQMGWSASRLRQVFQELEQAAVVETVPSPADRPGRPSKAYRLRSAT